ncbi:subtilisin-like protein [Epithele typhae]|uniref:subtilisin-like protein n=1 Tax=Epithele typhae TaxID=378194 RepID=UPI0020076726|nr:subtilisin-like protein [Epithele typhae]KAH9945128.1 subtilisin-like protein [Epithele typhae]
MRRAAPPASMAIHFLAVVLAALPALVSAASTPRNVEHLDTYLRAVSDPASPSCGRHWSPTRIAETFRPAPESAAAVREWLAVEGEIAEGRVALARKGDVLRVNATVAEAERLLGAEFFVYAHDASGRETVGCHDGFALPESVAGHVKLVSPTVYHFGTEEMRSSVYGKRVAERPGPNAFAGHEGIASKLKTPISESKLAVSGCDTAVTLGCLRAPYNFNYELQSADNNTVGVFEIQGGEARQVGLGMFFKKYSPDQVGTFPKLVSIENATLLGDGDLDEASLDIELMMGILGSKQELLLYQVSTTNSQQAWLDNLIAAFDGSYCNDPEVSYEDFIDCGNKPIPNVISMSYHFSPDCHGAAIAPVLESQCTEFGKLALGGLTIVASSGDGIVAYSQSHGYLASHGSTTAIRRTATSSARFPRRAHCRPGDGDDRVSLGGGGGFSNTFAMPYWQRAAVTNYVDKYAPAYGLAVYNRVPRRQRERTGATSASAPIFASFVAALNDARLAAGKSVVGWMNPRADGARTQLYSDALAAAYHDVTNGTNPGCGTQGYVAAPGWDPVTGLGTPNFQAMLEAFLALP